MRKISAHCSSLLNSHQRLVICLEGASPDSQGKGAATWPNYIRPTAVCCFRPFLSCVRFTNDVFEQEERFSFSIYGHVFAVNPD